MLIDADLLTSPGAGSSNAPGHSGLQLTYCTNIHAGDGWAEVEANVRRYAPALKRKVSPDRPFGLGLRVSAREARELLEGDRLVRFKRFLDSEHLYVALINGFPYGPFHGTPVKAQVYAPDWRDEARVRYTLDLVEILRQLLPEGMDGGISTVPLSYKPWVMHDADGSFAEVTANVVRVAERLAHLRRTTGHAIHLDIEPEPDCLIETTEEAIAFFDRWLRPAAGAEVLDCLQLCFDCCHAAVEFEDPVSSLDRLRSAGIRVGRIQLSSALEIAFPDDASESARLAERLSAFADSTYLHQVVERSATGRRAFRDLDIALRERTCRPQAWRVHFHVPLFTHDYQGLGSTERYVAQVLHYAASTNVTQHLEIETYTWDVLPPDLRIDLADSIAREYAWVLETLCTKPSSSTSSG